MNDINTKLTLLTTDQLWYNYEKLKRNDYYYDSKQLEVLQKYGTDAAITDLCILTGCWLSFDKYDEHGHISDPSLGYNKNKKGEFWTKSRDGEDCVYGNNEYSIGYYNYERGLVIRPVLQSSIIYNQISNKKIRGFNDTYEVEYGEYPQYAASDKMQKVLDIQLKNHGLRLTGLNYTFDSVKNNDYDSEIRPVTYDEYEYQGKTYIHIKANSDANTFELSNGQSYQNGDFIWIEVSPVRWLVDDKTKTLISKVGLVSGIRFLGKEIPYEGDFSKTEMNTYLDNYMSKDLFQIPLLVKSELPEDTNYEDVKSALEYKKEHKFLDSKTKFVIGSEEYNNYYFPKNDKDDGYTSRRRR